ncbi:MAG: class II D-tagatose-bisphosphate aldolase, non-catalytic subunit [Terracidiphilus sp.]|jgi:D-tagatose-1,6-bisphosphate aldolase subunit GatZ/KbaZ
MQEIASFRNEPVPAQPSEFLREVVRQNRRGVAAGTYAVCSAHPAVLDAAIQQSLADGTVLHVESTSSQVNQFGGYTGSTPAQFAMKIRQTAAEAGLPSEQILLGSDHLGPYAWRREPAATAMANARELAAQSVLAGYQKIHLDASMACGGDPVALPVELVAERTAVLCRAAEDSFASLPLGSPRPLYVIGTEVPIPGGEVAEGEPPRPTTLEDLRSSLDAFHEAFSSHGLSSAWENVIGIVVQPGVEFGDTSIFEYDPQKASHLVAGLPISPELVYEAHSTDYQTPAGLAQLVKDHFAILKVGPWLTFAFREAVFALGFIESEMPEHKSNPSRVRETLEAEMLRNPAHWQPYYHGDKEQQQFARAFSLSDRCRYYWPQPALQQAVDELMHNLGGPLPLALLSQYLPSEFDAIRAGRLSNSTPAIIRHHIQLVLKVYAQACGVAA